MTVWQIVVSICTWNFLLAMLRLNTVAWHSVYSWCASLLIITVLAVAVGRKA